MFTCLCLRYSDATYGLFPEYSGSLSSYLGKSHSDWLPLTSSYNKFSNPYLSIFDTLNSEYSHALYPIGHHVFRIPVKGGLTVVPAPNLGYNKGYSSYGDYSGLRHIPSIKKTPLNNYYSSHIIKSSDLSLLSQPRFTSTHSLSREIHLKNSHIPTHSIKQLDNSHLSLRGHNLHENVKSLHGTHGLSLSSPILKSYRIPLISSHHDHSGHIHSSHDLSHLHESDIGHDLTHSHLSDIGHGLSGIHSSDIEDHHTILHSNNGIHDSSHSVLHHDDSDDDTEHVIHDDDDGHYTPLHKSHLSEDDHHSYLDGQVISHGEKIHGHHTSEDSSEEDKDHYHKDSGKEYATQEQEEEEDSRDVKDDKYNKKPIRLPHKEEEKPSSHSYVEQKKHDHPKTYIQKDNYKNYQEEKHSPRSHHIKGYGKPLTKIEIHRPSKPYPQFPHAPKHDSYDVVKYSGGRHPVRPTHDNLEQTYYNAEPISKNTDLGADRHASYDVQEKIEHQEQLHDDEYKPSSESSYKPDSYRKPYGHIQKPKEHHYKSDSVQPRGRTKIYRNYEKPRTSSYEIEILHSDSSDQKVDGVENSEGNSEGLNEEAAEAFLTEAIADELDAFDSEESQQTFTEQKNEEDSDVLQNSEKVAIE